MAQLVHTIITEVKDEGVVQCTEVLELIMGMFPNEAPQAFAQTFVYMLVTLLKNSDEEETQIVLASYISILSRILYQNKQSFMVLLDMAQKQQDLNSKPTGALLLDFIERSLDRSDYIYSSSRKKILSMAFLNLYPSDVPALNERFSLVVNLCVQVMYESVDVDSYGSSGSIQAQNDDVVEFFIDDSEPTINAVNCEAKRRSTYLENDPIEKLDIYNAVVEKFNQMVQVMGPSFQLLLKTVDAKVMQQIQDYPKIKKEQRL